MNNGSSLGLTMGGRGFWAGRLVSTCRSLIGMKGAGNPTCLVSFRRAGACALVSDRLTSAEGARRLTLKRDLGFVAPSRLDGLIQGPTRRAIRWGSRRDDRRLQIPQSRAAPVEIVTRFPARRSKPFSRLLMRVAGRQHKSPHARRARPS
jgi:hypothetical protein